MTATFPEHTLHAFRHGFIQTGLGLIGQILNFDRIGPARALDERTISKITADRSSIKSSRHNHYLEIRSEFASHLPQKSQSQIGIEIALVKFVKNHYGCIFKQRVFL